MFLVDLPSLLFLLTNSLQVVVVQGNMAEEIAEYLQETCQLSKKWFDAISAPAQKKKKKR